MPKRNFILANGETYHIFNRSIAKESIFTSKRHLGKVLEIVDYYRLPQEIRLSKFRNLSHNQKKDYIEACKNKIPLVDVYSFAIMPNHYHFLLKQIQERGIVIFISNFQNSYAKFFNLRHDRNGSLFQKPFKGKRIENAEQLLHVSRYIHLNPVTAYLLEFEDLKDYPWTSYYYYRNSNLDIFINKEILMSNFKTFDTFSKFHQDQKEYQRTLALIKDHILE